jgi:hypothetical protein
MVRHYQSALLIRTDLARSLESLLAVRGGRCGHIAHAMVLAVTTAARRPSRPGRGSHGEHRRKERQQGRREQADGKQTSHGFRASATIIAHAAARQASLCRYRDLLQLDEYRAQRRHVAGDLFAGHIQAVRGARSEGSVRGDAAALDCHARGRVQARGTHVG